jgi:hypothetical protein
VTGQLDQIGPHQGFSSGEKQNRHLEGGKIINEGEALFGSQLIFAAPTHRLGVTVDAAKVAGPRAIPHHYGLLVGRKLKQMSGQAFGLPAISEWIRWFNCSAIEL